jgi:thioredoxin-related protein
MKHKLIVLTICIVFSMTLYPFALHAASGGILWYSYNEGMVLNQKEKKKVFVHFWASWCDYCKKMEANTFSNTSVIAYLNRNYISIKVDSDKEKDLSIEYRVSGLPDNWFLDQNSQKISNRSGYMSPKMFLQVLKFIHTDSYKHMSFKTFLEKM